MAEDARRCAVSGDRVSCGEEEDERREWAHRVATIRLGVGLSVRKQSLLSRVLSYAVRKDDIEGARCCCLVVDHQSWRPAGVSYITSEIMVQHTFNAVRASMSLVDKKQKCKLHAPGPLPSSSGCVKYGGKSASH
jgi:hypothetical protein